MAQEGPSSNTSASYNETRVKAATSTRAKHLALRKRGSTDTKNGSRPRPRNGLQRARSISEILPNLSTTRVRRQPIDWFGNEGGEDGVDHGHISPSHGVASVLDDRKNPSSASQPIGDTGRRYFNRETGFPRLPTRVIGDRGNSAITTRRQALRRPVGEDSDDSVEKVPRDFPPPIAAANGQQFILLEDVDFENRLNEGISDTFYRDTVPPQRDYYSRHVVWNDNYRPPPPRAGPPPPPPQNWPGGPPLAPYSGSRPISVLPRGSDSEDNTKSRRKKSSSTMLGWMLGKPIKKSAGKPTKKKSSSGKRLSVSSTEGSPAGPARPSEGIFQQNAPPIMTDLGRWQNRKANLWAELNPTISKDNTMGEAAQQAKMLAEFGKKNRHCIFGVKIEAHSPEEEDPYDSVDEPLDFPPTPVFRSDLSHHFNNSLTSRAKVPSRHLQTSRLTDDSSSNDEEVIPTFKAAGLEDEMKAWRLRGKGHNGDDNDDLYED
jgi:hypothetical protein